MRIDQTGHRKSVRMMDLLIAVRDRDVFGLTDLFDFAFGDQDGAADDRLTNSGKQLAYMDRQFRFRIVGISERNVDCQR